MCTNWLVFVLQLFLMGFTMADTSWDISSIAVSASPGTTEANITSTLSLRSATWAACGDPGLLLTSGPIELRARNLDSISSAVAALYMSYPSEDNTVFTLTSKYCKTPDCVEPLVVNRETITVTASNNTLKYLVVGARYHNRAFTNTAWKATDGSVQVVFPTYVSRGFQVSDPLTPMVSTAFMAEYTLACPDFDNCEAVFTKHGFQLAPMPREGADDFFIFELDVIETTHPRSAFRLFYMDVLEVETSSKYVSRRLPLKKGAVVPSFESTLTSKLGANVSVEDFATGFVFTSQVKLQTTSDCHIVPNGWTSVQEAFVSTSTDPSCDTDTIFALQIAVRESSTHAPTCPELVSLSVQSSAPLLLLEDVHVTGPDTSNVVFRVSTSDPHYVVSHINIDRHEALVFSSCSGALLEEPDHYQLTVPHGASSVSCHITPTMRQSASNELVFLKTEIQATAFTNRAASSKATSFAYFQNWFSTCPSTQRTFSGSSSLLDFCIESGSDDVAIVITSVPATGVLSLVSSGAQIRATDCPFVCNVSDVQYFAESDADVTVSFRLASLQHPDYPWTAQDVLHIVTKDRSDYVVYEPDFANAYPSPSYFPLNSVTSIGNLREQSISFERLRSHTSWDIKSAHYGACGEKQLETSKFVFQSSLSDWSSEAWSLSWWAFFEEAPAHQTVAEIRLSSSHSLRATIEEQNVCLSADSVSECAAFPVSYFSKGVHFLIAFQESGVASLFLNGSFFVRVALEKQALSSISLMGGSGVVSCVSGIKMFSEALFQTQAQLEYAESLAFRPVAMRQHPDLLLMDTGSVRVSVSTFGYHSEAFTTFFSGAFIREDSGSEAICELYVQSSDGVLLPVESAMLSPEFVVGQIGSAITRDCLGRDVCLLFSSTLNGSNISSSQCIYVRTVARLDPLVTSPTSTSGYSLTQELPPLVVDWGETTYSGSIRYVRHSASTESVSLFNSESNSWEVIPPLQSVPESGRLSLSLVPSFTNATVFNDVVAKGSLTIVLTNSFGITAEYEFEGSLYHWIEPLQKHQSVRYDATSVALHASHLDHSGRNGTVCYFMGMSSGHSSVQLYCGTRQLHEGDALDNCEATMRIVEAEQGSSLTAIIGVTDKTYGAVKENVNITIFFSFASSPVFSFKARSLYSASGSPVCTTALGDFTLDAGMYVCGSTDSPFATAYLVDGSSDSLPYPLMDSPMQTLANQPLSSVSVLVSAVSWSGGIILKLQSSQYSESCPQLSFQVSTLGALDICSKCDCTSSSVSVSTLDGAIFMLSGYADEATGKVKVSVAQSDSVVNFSFESSWTAITRFELSGGHGRVRFAELHVFDVTLDDQDVSRLFAESREWRPPFLVFSQATVPSPSSVMTTSAFVHHTEAHSVTFNLSSANAESLCVSINGSSDSISIAGNSLFSVSINAESFICRDVRVIVSASLLSTPDETVTHYVTFQVPRKSTLDHELPRNLIDLGDQYIKLSTITELRSLILSSSSSFHAVITALDNVEAFVHDNSSDTGFRSVSTPFACFEPIFIYVGSEASDEAILTADLPLATASIQFDVHYFGEVYPLTRAIVATNPLQSLAIQALSHSGADLVLSFTSYTTFPKNWCVNYVLFDVPSYISLHHDDGSQLRPQNGAYTVPHGSVVARNLNGNALRWKGSYLVQHCTSNLRSEPSPLELSWNVNYADSITLSFEELSEHEAAAGVGAVYPVPAVLTMSATTGTYRSGIQAATSVTVVLHTSLSMAPFLSADSPTRGRVLSINSTCAVFRLQASEAASTIKVGDYFKVISLHSDPGASHYTMQAWVDGSDNAIAEKQFSVAVTDDETPYFPPHEEDKARRKNWIQKLGATLGISAVAAGIILLLVVLLLVALICFFCFWLFCVGADKEDEVPKETSNHVVVQVESQISAAPIELQATSSPCNRRAELWAEIERLEKEVFDDEFPSSEDEKASHSGAEVEGVEQVSPNVHASVSPEAATAIETGHHMVEGSTEDASVGVVQDGPEPPTPDTPLPELPFLRSLLRVGQLFSALVTG